MSLEVKNLKYIYSPGMPGETIALDDVSFEIADGEICGVIGHTGSGKSTLLQHLNGLLKPSEGSITIDGQCITDGSCKMVDIRRKVGLVFQYPEYQLFEETVVKDVAFGPKNLGLADEEIDKRVREAIELVGLKYEMIADKSPFELSGGQKRRVAIAGVVAMHPQVLILDEPTAGLDPKAHDDILGMVERIHNEMGITIIFVSHNMADIAKLADRVLVVNNAKIAAQGTAREVFAQKDYLRSMGLDVPPVIEITKTLEERLDGYVSNALTPDEAADEICAYLKNKKQAIRG